MTHADNLVLIEKSIRTIENWPEPGVGFRDITTLLQDPAALNAVIDTFMMRYKDKNINVVAGLDARGFIFGPIIAYKLGVGFVPIRKKGKLPYKTFAETYTLEYGDVTTVEVHIDAVNKNDNVLLIDDLIATGGTMLAACKLINKLGANVVECAVINDLLYLNGSQLIRDAGFPVYSILEINS
jgi:adenine phosphoribosyltransferase